MRNSSVVKTTVSALIASGLVLGTALPAFAREAGSGMATGKKTVDIACVHAAIDIREDALVASWSAFNVSTTSAYSTRKTALHNAWSMTDAALRRAAIKAAWDNFKTAMKTARDTWKTSRRKAWDAFKVAAKVCKVTDLGAENPGSEE